MKLSDDKLKELVSTTLVGRPWPNDYANHTKPDLRDKKPCNIIAPAINNMSAELANM